MDLDQTFSSRDRLLAAARELFARNGYEQTSTSAIARAAGSSESQLVRNFSGKAGLLEAIFEEAWQGLNVAISERVRTARNGREAVVAILSLMIDAFSRDHDTASVFLFEGRRLRGNELHLSNGFRLFLERLEGVVRQGQEDGSFRKDLDAAILLSGMVGAAEGMVRDLLIAQRLGSPNPPDPKAIRAVFEAMIDGLG